ncbi:uncharacterized protein B0J15DRAFT_456797 [Neofusicoccum parvum]|uniref:Putative phloretin hydrolase protein n=1 Tax=Botryosphaeria parva (strain UCR-NP2) TaxID=1287680 RepID=R1GJH8_BOTPV|nr:putative phloretin hydrolase protein [Neofusicoccum parvum UCRNP2]GME38892.1 uncharacterized protein B0J15DRAFT_456797 [Neofusicoccum parvum]
MSDATQKGLSASPHASELAFSPYEAKDYLTRPGYLQLENGWSVAEDGTLMIAILTDIGNVTGEMYDWWFGWHLVESARYKLWHPQAHRYAWRTPNTLAWTATNASTLPSRYISSHSFIDEYIGNSASKLTVNFVAPSDASALAFDESTFADRGIETVVVGRLHSGAHTTNVTGHSYLAHQVRRTADGRRELRSRFWLEQYTEQAAHDMMAHCNIEMQHLASFLPALFEEFKDTA